MDYQKIKCQNYNIHLINTKKYHTSLFLITFTENVSKEKVTYRNALTNILTLASKKYDTRSKLIRKSQELYSLYPKVTVARQGNLLCTNFKLSTLDSSYIGEENIKDSIDYLWEIIFNPLVENNKFSKKYFDIMIKDEIDASNHINEDSMLYTNCKALELSSENVENYTITGYSDINILKEMTEEKLYLSYKEMLSNSKIDIFLSGNLIDDKIVSYIKSKFSFSANISLIDPFVIHKNINKIKSFKEKKEYEQSKLSVILKTSNLNEFEKKYVFTIFNTILGGNNVSLLMDKVRSENSLVYYIYSYHNKLDNIIVINAGFNKDNYDKVTQLIEEVLNDIKNGKFNRIDLNKSKLEYINNLLSFDETIDGLVKHQYGIEIFKTEPIDIRINNIKKVTKQDIINFTNKVNIDTIFFLEGDV